MSVAPSQSDISQAAIKNTVWSYLSLLGGKGLAFVSSVILAYYLTPEQYGIVGYCTLALLFLELINDAGLGSALISRREQLVEAANATFWIANGISVLLYGLAWLFAPLIADFFNEPQIIDLFRIIALVLLISGIGTVPTALLQRELRFKAKLIPDVGGAFAKGILSIILAVMGFGVWSLVYGHIAGGIVATLCAWALARWHPTRTFDRQVTREMLYFGGHITAIHSIGALLANTDYLLVGRLLGSTALGLYTMAYRIPDLLIRNVSTVVEKVAFPLLASLQTDPRKMRSVYFAYLRYISLFSFAAGAGLAMLTPLFIRTFYPPVWEPAIVPMQCIVLAMAIGSVGRIPGLIYKATNRPQILTRINLFKIPVVALILWVGTFWGIEGVAVGQIGVAIVSVLVETLILSRIAQFGLFESVRAVLPTLAAACMMAAAIGALALVLPSSGIHIMALLALVGAVAYIGALALLSRETLLQAAAMLRTSMLRSKAKGASV